MTAERTDLWLLRAGRLVRAQVQRAPWCPTCLRYGHAAGCPEQACRERAAEQAA